jgi:hypothetical protein
MFVIIALSTVDVVVTYAFFTRKSLRTYGCVGGLARTGYSLMIIIIVLCT